jgi:hypothetical protein
MQANPFGGLKFGKKVNSITNHNIEVVKLEESQNA